MLKIANIQFEPLRKALDADPETYVTVKRASLADEGRRYEALFGDSEVALMTDIAAVETWLTLVECDVLDESEQPVLKAGLPYEQFLAGLTAIWNYDPAIFWNIHRVVREANPQWQPPGDGEGNA